MSNSIMQKEKRCYFCGTTKNLQKHHCMNGANRKHADEDGLWVWLCAEHHTGTTGVHLQQGVMKVLRRQAQVVYEYDHTHEEWMNRYGRNYKVND